MQDSHQQVKLHTVSQFLQKNKIKSRPPRLLEVGFRFCKKSDISILISMGYKKYKSNNSNINKKWIIHHTMRVFKTKMVGPCTAKS